MSFSNSQNFANRIIDRVHDAIDDAGVEAPVVSNIAEGVLLDYSLAHPRIVFELLSGDGSVFRFALSSWTAATWVSGFSRIRWVQYPYATTTQDAQAYRLDESQFYLDPDPDAPTHLQFPTLTPANGASNIRVAWTALHTIGTNATTVPAHHQVGVEYLGACAVCEVQVASFGRLSDSGIAGDSADHKAKAAEWREIARMFCKRGRDQLGMSAGGEGGKAAGTPAITIAEFDPLSRRSGGPGLLYRRRKDT